jgi:hypothetical protein
VKRQRWCSDIDDGGSDRQVGGTTAFVVVRQESGGKGLAALAVVLVICWRQRQCWQWVWRAAIGTRGFGHTYHCVKNSALGSTFFCSWERFFAPGSALYCPPLTVVHPVSKIFQV